jgi:hypothetical protein
LIETRISYITPLEDNIIKVIIKENIDVTVEDLEENYQAYLPVFDENKMAKFLLIIGKGGTASKEVREEFAAKGRDKFKIAEAIVVKTPGHKLIANFILNFYKQKHPVKPFSNEVDALKWLKQF